MSRDRATFVEGETKSVTIYGTRYESTPVSAPVTTGISATMTYPTGSVTRTMTDVVTPNFKKRVANGEIINNPMTSIRIEEKDPVPTPYNRELLQVYDDKITGDHWQGSWPMSKQDLGDFLVPSLDPDWVSNIASLRSQAITSAHTNASSAELSVLMMAAEGRKSVVSLAQITRRAIKVVKAVRKADLKYLRKQIGWSELEDRYMEARYALRPLVYDARGIANALTQDIGKRTRATARGFAKDQYDRSDTIELVNGNGSTSSINRSVTVETNIRAGVLTDVELSKLNVWGGDQLLETALEITPYSFIANWIFNIADTVGAWAPSAGVRELASFVTVEHTSVATNSLGSIWNDPPDANSYRNSYSWSGTKSRLEHWKIRTVDPNLSVLPVVKVRLDTLKLIDLAIIGKRLIINRLSKS